METIFNYCVIVLGAAGLIYSITVSSRHEVVNKIINFIYKKILRPITYIIGGFTSGLVLNIIIGVIIFTLHPRTEIVKIIQSFEIVSLQDNYLVKGEIKGSAFFIQGYMNQEMVYSYYKKVNDQYVFGQVRAKDCIIKITNGKPKIEEYYLFREADKWDSGGWKEFDHYVIYVPKGGIVQDYDLDAK